MPESLRLDGVSVARGRRTVLADVSVTARYGSILAVLGPNGAGKSTLLDAIAGFVPARGGITLDGAPLAALDRRARARRIAYVPQQTQLDVPMRAYDVVAQGRFAHRDGLGSLGAADRQAIAAALADSDTTRFAERPFTTLSGGERRRVLIARALATGARVLLLDEPSAAFDIGQALALAALLRRLAESGHSIVVVLHQLDEAQRCADRALLLDGGRTVASGATADVIAHGPVRRVYDVELIPRGGFGYRHGSGDR